MKFMRYTVVFLRADMLLIAGYLAILTRRIPKM